MNASTGYINACARTCAYKGFEANHFVKFNHFISGYIFSMKLSSTERNRGLHSYFFKAIRKDLI